MNVQVKVTGLDELKASYAYAKRNADRYMSAAGKEAVERYILPVQGIKKYPPETAANHPHYRLVTFRSGRTVRFRSPYYIRGRGLQVPIRGQRSTSSRSGGRVSTSTGAYRDLHNSERYGTRWYVKRVLYGVKVGNTATHASYLTGTSLQSKAMAKIGWRKLIDVVNQNMTKITEVFQAWVDKLHHDAGLRTK